MLRLSCELHFYTYSTMSENKHKSPTTHYIIHQLIIFYDDNSLILAQTNNEASGFRSAKGIHIFSSKNNSLCPTKMHYYIEKLACNCIMRKRRIWQFQVSMSRSGVQPIAVLMQYYTPITVLLAFVTISQ